MGDSIFGTDGVRGEVGKEPITPNTVMKLGWAAGCVFAKKETGNQVLIGKDTRISGYLLESALEAGFSAAGMNVSLLGPIPTPAIAYLTKTTRACAGIVISASHNPYHDNGIKFFLGDGTKLGDDLVNEIGRLMNTPMCCVSSKKLGKASRFPDVQGRYIEYCKATFNEKYSLTGVTIVLDCANGSAYDVAPKVFEELGANVIAIANQPDGFNINKNCGSTDLRALKKSVLEHQADIGIALDGDGDRVMLVDGQGRVVDGDQILFILAEYRQQHNQLKGGVVGTVMTNLGLETAFTKLDIPFLRSKVGDRYVYEALIKNGWFLGGEASGHILCLDKSSTGDGIIAALQILEVMTVSEKNIAQLTQGLDIYPQQLINIRMSKRAEKSLKNNAVIDAAVAEVSNELGKKGRVLLRASGTEPLLRVMVEGEDEVQVNKIADELALRVKQAISL